MIWTSFTTNSGSSLVRNKLAGFDRALWAIIP